ncbi:MAG: hypothetical protein ACOH15_02850 [Acetobacterium sp.]
MKAGCPCFLKLNLLSRLQTMTLSDKIKKENYTMHAIGEDISVSEVAIHKMFTKD